MKPKVVLVGAGSLFFGRQFIGAMINSETLRNGTAALVDLNAAKLDKMVKLAQKAIEVSGSPLKLEWSTDRKDVLKDADFVVLSFANEGVRYRKIDCETSEKYGVRMCSGDTIGPGGIFRAMRELPEILRIAGDVARLCPDAWVINYINPTAVNGLGLAKYANVKSFALCDGFHMPRYEQNLMELVVPDNGDIEKFRLNVAGVNHFTWILDIRYDGKDASGLLRKKYAELAKTETNEGYSKAIFNFTYSAMLWDIFGLCPACVGHTKEYVPYWQGRGVLPDLPASLTIFDADSRQKNHDAMWGEVDKFIAGDICINDFTTKYKTDHATDIIEAMWSGKKQPYYINTLNRGAVPNLPDDAFLELKCDVGMDGPAPRAAGPFPAGLRSLEMQVIDTHELTVEAIMTKDIKILRRAMLTDPIVNSISDADAIIDELLKSERGALPHEWYT